MTKIFLHFFIVFLFLGFMGLYAEEANMRLNEALLDEAWKKDDPRYIELLGWSINKKDYYKKTTLHRAVEYGKYNIVKALIEKGAKVNVKDYIYYTPLHYSVSASAARKENKKKFHEIAKLLVENGADVNAKGGKSATSGAKLKHTPLHKAVLNNHFEIAMILVEKGSDVNAKDFRNYTPIYYAMVLNKNSKMVKYLVENGAKTNVSCKDGTTPLHKGVNCNREITVFLIAYGANLKAKDKHGKTPFDISYMSILPILNKASTPEIQTLIRAGDKEKVIEILSEVKAE